MKFRLLLAACLVAAPATAFGQHGEHPADDPASAAFMAANQAMMDDMMTSRPLAIPTGISR